MKTKKTRLRYYVVVGIVVLTFVSINLFNMYNTISKYKYRIGTEACNHIESINSLNQSNYNLLKTAMDIGSIENMDIVKLYENYKTLSSETMTLWNEYLFFEENKKMFTPSKHIEANKAILSDINVYIRDLFYSILEDEMKNPNYKLAIREDVYFKLEEVKNLSEEVHMFFNSFLNEKMYELSGEERKKVIIKNYYWIDMLQGVNKINESYMEKII